MVARASAGPDALAAQQILHSDHWDRQYLAGNAAWETGRPSTELRRVVAEQRLKPGQAIELGCGTGASAVWLALQSFRVTAVDLSRVAIHRARRRAAAAPARVRFVTGDLRAWETLGGPYDFFFDGGCYHAVRLADAPGYFQALRHITMPGTVGLVLVGNADEPEEPRGPPVVEERDVRTEFGGMFDILELRAFRFDPDPRDGRGYLGWSCLVRRRPFGNSCAARGQ